MGEAKRREELGIPPRVKIKNDMKNKENKFYGLLNKYPFLPFIVGFVLLTILIVDLVNFYK
tara:strand:- start:26 stop:208 length:183 start_codon:yes stop_codon:yes gene_type:complete